MDTDTIQSICIILNGVAIIALSAACIMQGRTIRYLIRRRP